MSYSTHKELQEMRWRQNEQNRHERRLLEDILKHEKEMASKGIKSNAARTFQYKRNYINKESYSRIVTKRK